MAKPKLTYFDAPVSRGEECRLALVLAGVEWEDVRIKRDDWMAMKPASPFGALPTFELPGRPVLGQSNAILALIGRLYHVHPKDDFEAARHEALLQHAEDLRAALGPSLRMTDDAEKKTARERFVQTFLPSWAAAVERQIEGPFVSGATPHVADVKLFVVTRWLTGGKVDHIPTTCLDGAPKLLALTRALADHDRVKAWYAKS